MKKLKAAIQYECMTSFKYIWYFYAIQYAIVLLISLIVAIGTGSFDNIGSNCLEINSLIFVGILGALGYREDFRMLIQNGLTRKYIFIATVSLYLFISGIMALVDTIMGNVLHAIRPDYFSLYGALYGYHNVLINWLWLFLVYMAVCFLLYLMILIINRIGKTASVCLGIALGGCVLLVFALFRFVLPDRTVAAIAEFARNAMGFMGDGTVYHAFPVLTLLLLGGILGIGSFAIIRRTELK